MEKDFKIFGIGLSKTATCSLTSLLRDGFDLNILHDPIKIHGEPLSLDSLANNNNYLEGKPPNRTIDGITDIQASILYKQLDNLYSNAKFILTIRDEEEWLESIYHNWSKYIGLQGQHVKRNSLRRTITLRMWGTTVWSRDKILNVYQTHKNNVIDHFKSKNNLLVLNITSDPDSVSKVENFLNKKSKIKQVPWENRRKT